MLFCPVYWRVGGLLNPKAAVVRQTDLLGLKRDKTRAENPAFTEPIGWFSTVALQPQNESAGDMWQQVWL